MGFRNAAVATAYRILTPNEGALTSMNHDTGINVAMPVNTASFLYFWLPRSMTVTAWGVIMGNLAGGTVELAVYQNGAKKASTGAIATPAFGVPTKFTLATPAILSAGDSWLACVGSNAFCAFYNTYNGDDFPFGYLRNANIGGIVLPNSYDPEVSATDDTSTGVAGYAPWPSVELFFA